MDQIYGHTRIKQKLAYASRHGRLHHAYLFVGPKGVGKASLARGFVKTLYCERFDPEGGRFCACGQCEMCLRFDRSVAFFRNHVKTNYFSSSGQKEPDKPIAALGLPDYMEIEDGKAMLSVDVIRLLQEKLSHALYGAPHRYVLIPEASKMNISAANCLLKTLEEPTTDTTFILTTSQPERLLPTVVSRCQLIRFAAFEHNEVEAWLRTRYPDAQDYVIAQVATMASGSLGNAIELMEGEDRDAILSAFQKIINERDAIEALCAAAELKGKKQIFVPVVRLLMLFLRDILLVQTVDASHIVLRHHQDLIIRCATACSPDDVMRSMEAIGTCYEAFLGNGNELLLWERLALSFQRVLFKR